MDAETAVSARRSLWAVAPAALGLGLLITGGVVFFGETRSEGEARVPVRLAVPVSRQDFGRVGVSENRTAQYKITNNGLGPVRILRWHPNCACVGYESDTPVIAPAATATVSVTWKFGKDPGEVVDSIGLTLGADGEDQPADVIHLYGVATVEPDYVIEPHTVAVSKTAGEPAVARLRGVFEQGVTIRGARSSNPMLEVTVVDDQIRVKAVAGASFDKAEVVVVTSSVRQPTAVLTVTAK